MNHQGQFDRDSILELVKGIVLNNLVGMPAKVYLFGSWARAEEKRSSDIDIAIELDPCAGGTQAVLTNTREALEESSIPYKVDVVHLNIADEFIVNKVRKEGVLWADQTNG